MRKILYFFLTVSLIFSSCKKEEEDNTPTVVEGCTDSEATNYNANATSNDGSCMYNITGVWETTSAVLNGANVLTGLDLIYVWDDEDIGTETYDASGNMISYALGSGVSGGINVINWTGTVYPVGGTEYPAYLTINIDIMTNNNNMTWHYVDYPTAADTYVKTLIRSNTYSLSDWK
jgi:hypothetical protein